MPIQSNVLAFVLPHTCMSVYYCDNSGMVEQLCGYEGVSILEIVVQQRNAGYSGEPNLACLQWLLLSGCVH